MKSQKTIFIFIVLAAAVMLFTAATQIQQPQLRQPYSIVLRETNFYPDGHSVLVYTESKWTAVTGDWYSVKVFATGQIEKQFGRPGSGVFMYNPRRRQVDYIRAYPANFPNPKINLKSPEYVSTGAILGYTAYLLHSQANGMSVDTWLAQDLNGDIIKQVITKNGVIMQLDPVTVDLLGPGDPVPPPSWSIP